jgi:hypothetical protein
MMRGKNISHERVYAMLAEGLELMRNFKLIPAFEKESRTVADHVLRLLNRKPDAERIAAVFQSLYEARMLIRLKNSVPAKRILLGDYFLSLAAKLSLPLRDIGLTAHIQELWTQQDADGELMLLSLSRAKFLQEVSNFCRGYIEQRYR